MLAVNSVAQCFDRGAKRYDELATVQQKVSDKLVSMVAERVASANSVVDLGCGTGQLLAQIRQKNHGAVLHGVDISKSMLMRAMQRELNATLLNENLLSTSLPDSSSDLVTSTSALQWVDLNLASQEIYRLLAKDGLLAMCCFTKGTLQSWRELWGVDDSFMPSSDSLVAILESSGLSVIQRENESLIPRYNEFDDALASVRELGANANRGARSGLLGRRKFDEIKYTFQMISVVAGGFPMEYEVSYILAKRKV